MGYIHTYITYITYIFTYMHTYIYTYVHTYIHTYIHTHIHTYIHTYIYTHAHIDPQMYIIRVHARTETHTHACMVRRASCSPVSGRESAILGTLYGRDSSSS